MPKLYLVPSFLKDRVDEGAYVKWLRRKVAAHVRRDRKRSASKINGMDYRTRIHAAVCASEGSDHYTGEPLDWSLIGTYCNERSKAGRSIYKAGMALLPTIDHVLLEDGTYGFVVCAWRTNDAKNDLSHDEFISLCRRVIQHHEGHDA
jgi:hypothetical protein